MNLLLAAFVLAFGAVIGSFLNAVIFRLRVKESPLRGRSHCFSCGHELSALDLIPVLSWFCLRGRCRYCRAGVSWQYPAVESAVAVLFLLFALHLSPADAVWTPRLIAELLFGWAVASVMTVVFVYDLRYMLILRSVTFPAAVLAVAANLALGMSPLRLVLGLAVGYGFFWLQFVLSRGRWIGGGDLHLGLLMGAVLGFAHVLLALWVAYVVGAVISVALLAMRRQTWRGQIPFGTFLSFATVTVMLCGDRLLAAYFGYSV